MLDKSPSLPSLHEMQGLKRNVICLDELQKHVNMAQKMRIILERNMRKLEERYETVDRWKSKYMQREGVPIIHHKPLKQKSVLKLPTIGQPENEHPLNAHAYYKVYELKSTIIDKEINYFEEHSQNSLKMRKEAQIRKKLKSLLQPALVSSQLVLTHRLQQKELKEEKKESMKAKEIKKEEETELQKQIAQIERQKKVEREERRKQDRFLEQMVACVPEGWNYTAEEQTQLLA